MLRHTRKAFCLPLYFLVFLFSFFSLRIGANLICSDMSHISNCCCWEWLMSSWRVSTSINENWKQMLLWWKCLPALISSGWQRRLQRYSYLSIDRYLVPDTVRTHTDREPKQQLMIIPSSFFKKTFYFSAFVECTWAGSAWLSKFFFQDVNGLKKQLRSYCQCLSARICCLVFIHRMMLIVRRGWMGCFRLRPKSNLTLDLLLVVDWPWCSW